jgi:membrane-anchored glycerophosphoryl diester phosphodiesterase (GDPDase)
MRYNQLVYIRSITFFTTTFTLLSFFTILTFAQSEVEEKERMNQTMQDISNSTNLPIQNTTQTTANETGEAYPIQKNVTDFGANITEGAKDLVGNIGEGLQNLPK